MGDEEHGGPAFFGFGKKRVQHFASGVVVQIAGGFVRQQEFGVRRKSAGDGGPLLFAAGQLRRKMAHPVRESDGGKRFGGGVHGVRASGELERQGGVFVGGHGFEQVKMLKNDADIFAPHLGEFFFVEFPQILPENFDFSGGGAEESADNGEQACFTGAGRSGQGGGFSGGDGKAGVFQNMHGIAEREGNAGQICGGWCRIGLHEINLHFSMDFRRFGVRRRN